MKTKELIYLLLAILGFTVGVAITTWKVKNTKDNSFEDYIEWCNQEVEVQYVSYGIDYNYTDTLHIRDFYYDNPFEEFVELINDSTYAVTYKFLRFDYSLEYVNNEIKRLKELGRDMKLSATIKTKTKKMETPTIEGYQKWKGNKK